MRGTMLVAMIFAFFLVGCAQTMNFGFGDKADEPATEERADSDSVLPMPPDRAPATQPKTQIRASVLEPSTKCGDTICEGTENECSCPTDCGSCEGKATGICEYYQCTPLNACVKVQEATCCGDGACGNGESCDNCFVDCCTTAKTLADFPGIFARVTIIVGKDAPAENIVTAANLAAAFKQMNIEVSETKLDSEVFDLRIRDYAVVGNPCDNTAAAALLGVDSAKHKNLCDVVPRDEAQIRLIPTSAATHALLITGGSAYEVERAAKRLVAFQQRPLSGMMVKA